MSADGVDIGQAEEQPELAPLVAAGQSFFDRTKAALAGNPESDQLAGLQVQPTLLPSTPCEQQQQKLCPRLLENFPETVQDMFILPLYQRHASPATHAEFLCHMTIHMHGSKRTSG